MARGDKYVCRTCGQEYTYCEQCIIRPIPHLGNGFCSESCSDIFETLSKHGCHLATAQETLTTLGSIEGKTFRPSIQAHIDAIKAEAGKAPAVEAKIEIIEETVAESAQDSKKKKKW